MYTPFLPFIVAFSRVIKTCDAADLSRIEKFAMSLRPANTSAGGMSMMQRLLQLLYETARLYVESRGTSTTPDYALVHGEFNSYMSMLGFAAPAASLGDDVAGEGAGEEETGTDGQDDDMGWHNVQQQQHPLGDWYRDNQDMMGLLDEDVLY